MRTVSVQVEKGRKLFRAVSRFFADLVVSIPELTYLFFHGLVLTGKGLLKGFKYLLEGL